MIDLGLGRISRLLQLAPAAAASASAVSASASASVTTGSTTSTAPSAPTACPPWKAIHVAGTNGKGSVCAYLSAMLHARGLRCARFTSPHLVDRWDSIVLDERVVSEAVFRSAEQAVVKRDREHRIGATEFELLTATAMDVFDGWASSASSGSSVPLVAVEAGLGGALDATTAMPADRAVTVITHIALDHQALLGATTAAIAQHKAGIMRAGVPCVVDRANRQDEQVTAVLEAHARAVGAPLIYAGAGGEDTDNTAAAPEEGAPHTALLSSLQDLPLEPHQRNNLACAYTAFCLAVRAHSALAALPADADLPAFLAGIVHRVRWPGRLQRLDVAPLLAQPQAHHLVTPLLAQPPAHHLVTPLLAQPQAHHPLVVLLDGAHNPQSAAALGSYVDKHMRPSALAPATSSPPITWILAASQGKDLDSMLPLLLRPGDRVATVAFGPVDGMPWVRAAEPAQLLARAAHVLGWESGARVGEDPALLDAGDARNGGLVAALKWARQKEEEEAAAAANAETAPSIPRIVIAGSLYLVSDTLRLLRQAGGETGMPEADPLS